MIPLIPAVVLAFTSFLASAFVILRIVIPILPPSPLSRRVSPAEFGLPAFGSLSPADKGHIWLASLDLVALIVFVWHVVAEATSGPTGAALAQDPLSTTRVVVCPHRWVAHFLLARSIGCSGPPVALLAITSTALAGVLAGAGVHGLFPGLAAYTGTFAILTSMSFAFLFATLYKIKKNLAALNRQDEDDTWPPAKQVEEQPRPSFGTDEIDFIKDGASWITSNASRRNSLGSTWSFSTHQTAVGSQHGGSRPSSRNQWLSAHNDDAVPPVPPLPSQYGVAVENLSDPDPFRRNAPPPIKVPDHPHYRARVGSQTSWLTSNGSEAPPVSPWNFTPNASMVDLQTAVSRPATPGLATAQVLGGYGFAPNPDTSIESLAAPPGADVDWSLRPVIGWSIYTWLPFVLALPYTILLSQQATVSTTIYVLYILSVTLSAPLLALNLVFRAGLPIPTCLFDAREPTQAATNNRVSTSPSELPQWKWSQEYKRSMSTTPTVVEGRPSGDVWIQKGDAVDGKSKFGRAMSMLTPAPKLSVLPPLGNDDDGLKPPVPIHEGDSSLPVNIHSRSHSETSAQFGKLRSESRATTNQTSSEEAAYQSKIMVAQRHYSALAQTFVVPATSPEPTEDALANATGVTTTKKRTHLRNRSTASSMSGPLTPNGSSYGNISPPPPFPLPPTPPNVRAARLLAHQKSFSSSYSFGPVDNMNEIDALTAGVLPLLVPGLKVGDDMKIKDGDYSPPGTFSKSKGKKAAKKMTEFGTDFSSPEVASTPAAGLGKRPRKDSHKTHFSLPSLSLGKEAIQALASDVRGALESNFAQYAAVPSSVHTDSLEEDESSRLARSDSARSLGLKIDVPRSIGASARSSMNTILEGPPPSSASEVTLFEEFEAGLMEKPHDHHSTPHASVAGKPARERAPPVPKISKKNRSSIVYIKSENAAPAGSSNDENVAPQAQDSSAPSSIASWGARMMSKTGSLRRKNFVEPSAAKSADSPKEGLRRLSLLQDRDTNSLKGSDSSPDSSKEFVIPKGSSVRPLTLGKKQRRAGNDENAIPEDRQVSGLTPRADGKSLKPLKLARSETSRMRGILRRSEQLPEVVVRPPSMTSHIPFSYNFGDQQ
ncbi:hypothetical protein BKA70DRAFT_1510260 [Coprinopsis sp. MPI-PUGE-AT-0042]|nr:hypothetical protein BKA70DRAFT_1510260 [Coprinopsis sp. MPI-PUGE-AT-0042]